MRKEKSADAGNTGPATISCHLNDLSITVEKEGGRRFAKAGYPIRFGKYSEIRTPEYEFHFNLKGEIKFIRGLNGSWPHPSEWLKRTDGNDWNFYSVGTVNGNRSVIGWLGEYYLPCLPYPSNSICPFNPYTDPDIAQAFAAWSQLYANLYEMPAGEAPPRISEFITRVRQSDENTLHARTKRLHAIIGGRVSVLPPDTRHVDYEVIPLTIADGCLYHCNFCCVKSPDRFQSRSKGDILRQIKLLKDFYRRNLGNYNALFLGNHDALGAGDDLICMAASEAFDDFYFANAHLENPKLFMFGSVASLLKARDGFLRKLDALPFYTYINIGLESVDAPTLAGINKPVEIGSVRDAFEKMLEINREYPNIEVTANFLLGEQLSVEHHGALAELLRNAPVPARRKGAIYLSPLQGNQGRDALLQSFFEIKKASRLPVYIYLIQRL